MSDPSFSEAFKAAADIEAACPITAGSALAHHAGWTTEWPTEPGHYWLYGVWYIASSPRPSLWLIKAEMLYGYLYLSGDCGNVYEGQVGPHRWARATLPEVPAAEVEREIKETDGDDRK